MIAMTEQFKLGVHPPIRESGDIADTPGCTLEGTTGSVKLERGVICALRHIHMAPEDALRYGVRDKSVVWLWLGGGPPQAETWDPKPDAPDGVGTMFGVARTSLPGVTLGSHFPKLAERAHRLAIVRSFQTPCSDHQDNFVRTMLTGTEAKLAPSAGSVVLSPEPGEAVG